MSEQIKAYFDKNASCLNVRGIEVRAGVPPKTLDHFVKGRRGIPPEAAEKIIKVLQSLHYEN